MLVAQHLDFDVARVVDELLDEACGRRRSCDLASERASCEALLGLLGVEGDAHALAAAAGGGLDHDRIADLVGDLHGVLGVVDLADVAGHGRDLGGCGRLLALDLVAHGGDGLADWAR